LAASPHLVSTAQGTVPVKPSPAREFGKGKGMTVHEFPAIDDAPEEASRISAAIDVATRRLLSIQHADGHWCGELEGDTILESEYALTFFFLGRGADARVAKAGEYLRRKQLADGGWPIYPGGPAEVSSSVKAYFVLKLLGDDPAAPHMEKARTVIQRLGGVEACNSFTK